MIPYGHHVQNSGQWEKAVVILGQWAKKGDDWDQKNRQTILHNNLASSLKSERPGEA